MFPIFHVLERERERETLSDFTKKNTQYTHGVTVNIDQMKEERGRKRGKGRERKRNRRRKTKKNYTYQEEILITKVSS